MKTKHIFLKILAVVLFQLTFTTTASGYYLMLPGTPSIPSLPYVAEKDHYSGPASVQMILNSCPNIMARCCPDQDDIYNSIMSHNTEPTTWFSDPEGIRGALEDPIFSPLPGIWNVFSHTDKNRVMGELLYWMNRVRYLMPVSISSSEHWVTVFGYQTDVVPTSPGSTVTLLNIFFYDPLPGNSSIGAMSGNVWLTDSAYWGVPLNKPGSAWHNKYIAVIEPPAANLNVVVPQRILEGRILPIEEIERCFYRWLEEVRKSELVRGQFEILKKDVGIEKPILVKATKYSYYLIPFKDRRLAAIFNAYDGSFEEFRYFQQPQRYILDPNMINNKLREVLRAYKTKIIKILTPELQYNPELTQIGRFSPIWEVQATVEDARKKKHKLSIYLNIKGDVIKGLERLKAERDVIKKQRRKGCLF